MVKECEMDKTIFECESVDGRDSLLVERHAGWIVLNGIWAPVYISNESAESLALALLDDLGKGWKPYPENKPDYGLYTVTLDDGQVIPATYVPAQNKWHDGIIYNNLPLKVTAYSELPAPYQPREL